MSRAYYRKRSEATEQERVINWATFYAKDFPELDLLHHIPNGGSRNQLEAANLKRQGVKDGVPDLCLPVARNGKHGLYVEMKWQNNKTTEKQDWWLEQLRQQGYETAVCWSAEEAMDTIAGYLGVMEQTVPYYSTMKRAGAFRQPQKPQKRQKRTTLTEYSQNGQKAILKPHVTVNQAAKKLYDYEQTGLSPHEVTNLVEQVQNLTRRVKKYESWEE